MRKTLLTQNGHEDIEVGGISNQQLTIWPGVRLLEINQYEAEASKTRSRLAHLRLGDPGSSSTGTAIRTHGPFLAILLDPCRLVTLFARGYRSGNRPR